MPTIMVSISGIRGIIGDGLDPQVIVKYVSAYADFVKKGKIVIGRDARISGEMVKNVTIGTLLAKGFEVIDIGIVPTPTVQYTVKTLNADGGIAITASHNPNEWNALKLLNKTGQFLTPEENVDLQEILINSSANVYKPWNEMGKLIENSSALKRHMEDVLKLKYIDVNKIRAKKFRVVADCVNGAGVYVIPELLKQLGCEVIEVNCEKTGIFPRLPEPIPANLTETMEIVKKEKADIGIVVDPDVDRLVLITDKGEAFGEENTIVSVIKFILGKEKGNTAVNLSTTRAVDDIAKEFGCEVFRSSVGEANVVKKMKEVNAIVGGEGSGGVILPALHYGRDALVGIVIILQLLTEMDKSISELKAEIPAYYISKKKIELKNVNPDSVIDELMKKYTDEKFNNEDGLKIDFPDHWVHFRKSNTEPIIRIVTESKSQEEANSLSEKYFNEINELVR